MPQLCFGTAQNKLDKTINSALKIGYRHIDCADAYGNIEYKTIIKNAIQTITRKTLWITWKSSNITIENITLIIQDLNCDYIDLFLIHFGCGNDLEFEILKQAQINGQIRYYGVSNCENIETIRELKTNHNIYANQIQARPPNGNINSRKKMSSTFIEDCNQIDVKIMLFGTISGIQNQTKNFEYFEYLKNVNKYYLQKYIKDKPNTLIVSSVNGNSLFQNYDDFKLNKEKDLLNNDEMTIIEEQMQKLELSKQ